MSLLINIFFLIEKSYSKFRPTFAGYNIDNRIFFFGSTTKTARAVSGIPLASFSSGSNMRSCVARSLSSSAMIGYGKSALVLQFEYNLISSIHFLCDSTLSHDTAATLTLRFANSECSTSRRASSVVHTGVKSAGWEKRIPQL